MTDIRIPSQTFLSRFLKDEFNTPILVDDLEQGGEYVEIVTRLREQLVQQRENYERISSNFTTVAARPELPQGLSNTFNDILAEQNLDVRNPFSQDGIVDFSNIENAAFNAASPSFAENAARSGAPVIAFVDAAPQQDPQQWQSDLRQVQVFQH